MEKKFKCKNCEHEWSISDTQIAPNEREQEKFNYVFNNVEKMEMCGFCLIYKTLKEKENK